MAELQNIFKTTVIIGIHLTVRNELGKNFDEIEGEILENAQKSVIEILDLYEPFMEILDKNSIGEEALNTYTGIFKGKKLNDSDVIKTIESNIAELEEEEKKIFFDSILLIALKNDDKISVKEKQLLAYFYKRLNISDESFSNYVENFLKSYKKVLIDDTYGDSDEKLEKTKESEKKSSKSHLILSFIAFICLLLLGVSAFLFFKYGRPQLKLPPVPSIVFKKVIFERYVAAGNFDTTTNRLFNKLVVFYIKGDADIQFDTENIKLKQKKGRWFAVYKNPYEKKLQFENILPFKVDVNISQKNYEEVINVEPERISNSLASDTGKLVGAIAGVAGAYIGGKLGANIGKFIGKVPIISGGLGALTGGTILGGAAGYTGYVMTKKFLTGMQLSPAITQGDKDKIFENAKKLIAAELLFDERLQNTLIESFETYVKNFYKKFGIDIVEVKYE